MASAAIPVYDICSISKNGHPQDLLAERFPDYLEQHYQYLHHPHRHTFYHLALFTRGSGTHTIDFVKFEVKAYQLYFMAPGQVHSWNFEEGIDGFVVHFSADLFRSFLLDPNYLEQFPFFSGNSRQGVCQLPGAVQGLVTGLLEDIVRAGKQAPHPDVDIIRLRLIELFLTVERHCMTADAIKHPKQQSVLLNNFQQLINQYYRTMRLPKEYAELLYITPNHLNALCRALLGKTAGDLIRERVLLEAKRLLTNAHMSITEIAYELNFQDNSYFNRFFKKNEGMTPEEFRKEFIHQ
ncbi:AraC family transcriptional regulator [Chitinophaga pendula]|uniref:AraC family transcriptional regulator n=1 Tax=Chitinophaga TaxID=79328 RepID=UPI000BAFB350|nr:MULTISPECIES: helix-turn-helix transcriptional regulator [Chitinophaga]ASZ11897.1 AraC family transcriptional regulator [Chitinophaga sp. MD30]UCJ05078.1 AraC family transcriptional regulator [Chitinophaga pendula]